MPNLHTVVSFFSSTCHGNDEYDLFVFLVPRAWSFKFRFGAMIIGIQSRHYNGTGCYADRLALIIKTLNFLTKKET